VTDRRPRDGDRDFLSPGSRPVLVTLLLALCAAMSPSGLALLAGGRVLWSLPTALAATLLAGLVLVPAGVAVILTLRGLPAVLRAFAEQRHGEHEQIFIRIVLATAGLAYALALALVVPERDGWRPALAVVAGGLILSWVLLGDVLVRPAPLRARRLAGMALDVGTLSAFLHFGEELTAAWYPVYLWIACDNGFRYGQRALLASGTLVVIGFAAVIVTTPFWAANPLLAAGLLLALALLPAYVATLIHSLAAAQDEAAAAGTAKGSILATKSDELRAPLNTVISAGALIEQTELGADQRQLFATMQLAARRLLELVDEIRDAAPPPFDLRRLSVAIVTADEAFAGVLGAKLRLWRAEPVWLGDPGRAFAPVAETEAAPRWPVLLVDARRDAVEALAFGRRLRSELPALEAALVFIADPAWSESMAILAEGTLGTVLTTPLDDGALANALRLLSQPRAATVPVEPGPSAMSSAPEPSSAEVAPAETLPPRATGPSLRVLVAEDAPAPRKTMQRALERAGHEVVPVERGDAALEVLDAGGIDVAVMAVSMPGMSGYEAVKLYRMTHLDGPRLPIVAVAAEATVEIERRCRDAGMDALLTKPIEVDDLLALIESIVAGAALRLGEAAQAMQFGGAAGAAARGASPNVVTPISAHPRFPTEANVVIDDAAIEALRNLGAGSDFFRDVIQTFRSDARRLLDRLRGAAVSGDLRGFREHAHALRSSAANVGGARLCAELLALREATAGDLRQQGGELLAKLHGEFARLDAALDQKLREGARG
jgi:CheY-like chemotaxis protein/signal transduction histidine kinase/HPt (histidine-containing phosphotransfer) domain-containing protein